MSILWTFLFVLAVSILNVSGDDTYLKKISYECSRVCDTHFSDGECWEKTFAYFINHLLQSLVDIGNANSITKYPGINDLIFTTYNQSLQDPDVGDFIQNVLGEFELLLNRTLTKIPGLTTDSELAKKIKCPVACRKDSLVVWISLFSVFCGLTLAAIIAVTIYIAYIKAKHRKFEKLSKT